jgi:hypothetical protein
MDYRIAYTIAKVSDLFFRENKSTGTRDYLIKQITEHFIWKKFDFWNKIIMNMITETVFLFLRLIEVILFLRNSKMKKTKKINYLLYLQCL